MKKQKHVMSLSFVVSIIALSGIAVVETPLPLPLPEGTPDKIDGFYSRQLYNEYRHLISKDIEEAYGQSLGQIRTGFVDGVVANRLRKNGASFRYYPEIQTQRGEKALGQVYYSCNRSESCDWVLKITTVPIVDTADWAYNNFDAATAVSNLKERDDIEPDDLLFGLGFLMKLPSPKPYILMNAKNQLYFGKECPAFINILGSNDYGQGRVKHLLNISTANQKSPVPKHVKSAVFDISIIETAEAFKVSYTQPTIELTLSGQFGDEIGNKLFESLKDCPNRADS